MKKYEKPIVMINDDLAEGVYAAPSGYCDDDCYRVEIEGHQVPEGSRLTHKFQLKCYHLASETDGHCGSGQMLIVKFDKPVNYVSSKGTLYAGDGTNELMISYAYTQNAKDEVGLGDIEVSVADNGSLNIESAIFTCNHIKNW